MEKLVIAADVGGSHITSSVIDLNNKTELENSRSRVRLNSEGSAVEIINTWARSLEYSAAFYDLNAMKINIAMPGPMDYKNGICKIKDQSKYKALYNMDIKCMLAERLNVSSSSIHFMNDAACFLKGEVFSGNLTGCNNAIGLTLGTGLGTSYFYQGQAIDLGLWNMPFLEGIAEDYISTRWFIKRFYELSGVAIKDVKDLVDNHLESPYFRTMFAEFSVNLANFIYKFIRKKMPVAAVLGGNITNAKSYFLEDTRKHLGLIMGYSFPIEISTLGEKAALLGASTGA